MWRLMWFVQSVEVVEVLRAECQCRKVDALLASLSLCLTELGRLHQHLVALEE